MEEKEPVVILAEDVPQQDFRQIPWHVKASGADVGMQCHYSAHWNYPPKELQPEQKPGVRKVGHPPHMHRENEIIMLIGCDPYDPYDLGATVEMCFGKNMEKRTFSRSCTIMIPGGTPHGFYNTVECHAPFLFLEIQEAPNKTEKFLWEYLTKEEMDSVEHIDFWKDVGFDD